ncbi:MAG: S26 family signal peptidase, partial [Dactylosporangium sp.]|nr:S26 family signal peptidase [Dactylosporangium sp.]
MGYVIVGVLVAALLVGVAALLATRFAVVVVHGPSMAPTFRDGDRVLARQVGRAR